VKIGLLAKGWGNGWVLRVTAVGCDFCKLGEGKAGLSGTMGEFFCGGNGEWLGPRS